MNTATLDRIVRAVRAGLTTSGSIAAWLKMPRVQVDRYLVAMTESGRLTCSVGPNGVPTFAVNA